MSGRFTVHFRSFAALASSVYYSTFKVQLIKTLFLYIKLQERLIKTQLTAINKTYLKIRHVAVLSKL